MSSRILIVEDEVVVAMYIETLLVTFGYEVAGIVTNGKDAIDAVKNNGIALILMDINIEGDIDGIETVKRIKEFSDVPVIYVSAYIDKETIDRAAETKPASYLSKPFKNKDLKDIIDSILR
ncbi:MAG: two-component system, response regulator PdtaR [Candidatus Methanomethylophilaceae archaeon]|nr:two-component system, response regulator PdtaR [Candidatus Methanomethylophilaceae archaeon]MDI3542204.1 two-component system, response regulator PdtaR [Candidatus Methanomethylophilaceae archaeon]HIJ00269.1 response regulator [Candidatus Methanomethylophilaceae archaeon]